MNHELEAGALVAHRYRPGVWRIVGRMRAAEHVAIEPWDETAAASLLPHELYTLIARAPSLTRLWPARSASPYRPLAAATA
jgi:hypothetical protein